MSVAPVETVRPPEEQLFPVVEDLLTAQEAARPTAPKLPAF
ncbi:MAG: hypothetical protein ACLP0J_25735 [Solirubrobacteraceae bacterium]